VHPRLDPELGIVPDAFPGYRRDLEIRNKEIEKAFGR